MNSDPHSTLTRATPILALDFPDAEQAVALLERIPAAAWVKVGLQLFTAAGPGFVRELRASGRRVFLDLKLHDIPNTVGRAVEAAATIGVELLTVHASGGSAMLRAAAAAAGGQGEGGTRLLAVTVLTSLSDVDLAESWGRTRVSAREEVARLASLAAGAGIHGVVASVHEATAVRDASQELAILTPGIRLPGDDAGDQARIATPEAAAAAGVDFLVLGRSVTAAADPAAAWDLVLDGIIRGEGGVQGRS